MAQDGRGGPRRRPDAEISDMRDLLSFRLHRLIVANERLDQRRVLDRFGLTLPQWRAAGVIGALGPDAPVARVLEELGMNKSQFSREFKALEARGLATATTDEDDRRRLRVSLTVKGERMHLEMLEVARAQSDALVSELSPEAADALARSLDALIGWTERALDDDRED